MQTEYVNRRGDRYYIFQGKTKTGKPKYFASKRATSEKGSRIESLPEHLEVYENPGTAVVSVRRRKPSRVLPAERELVDRLALELSGCSYVQTIVEGDQIVIYTPDRDPSEAAALLERVFGSAPGKASQWTARNTNYTAEMRFALADVDERTYFADRFCYRGSVDDWITIGGPGELQTLAKKLLPHLGCESFFDMF